MSLHCPKPQRLLSTISPGSRVVGKETSGGREVNEQWMKPGGGIVLGMARTVAQGKAAEFEFTQIREDKDGAIYYVLKPSGQAEASFKLVRLQNQEAVFENPQHDFPQRNHLSTST